MRDAPFAAKAIDTQAASWIERRHFGPWNEPERAEFDAWLTQSIGHRVAYLRLNSSWKRTERLAALTSADVEPLPNSQPKSAKPFLMKIAAGFAVLLLAGMSAAYFLLQPRDRIFSTPVGGHEIISFADGSRVELNTDTVLRARMTTDQRVVWLDRGEAYFDIKHDPVHPFVVMIGNHRITDLGTKFSVHRESARMEVAVVQGRVWFDNSVRQTTAQSVLLTQGDVAVATASEMTVTHKSAQALAVELNWRRGLLVFDKAALADVAAAFNRYNHTKLVIGDPAAASVLIGGTFRANDVEDFARLAQTVLGLRVRHDADEIVISR